MTQKDDILLQEVAEALLTQQAPEVDICQRVMDALPPLKVVRYSALMRVVKHASIAAAACFLLVVAVDLTRLFAHDYDEASIARMVAKSYDADYYTDSESTLFGEYAYLY